MQGSIFGVVDTNPDKIIKIVEKGTNLIHPINKPPKDDNYRYTINLVMILKDNGKKQASANHVNVYLTSGDEEAHVFDNWEIIPKLNDKKAWKTIS